MVYSRKETSQRIFIGVPIDQRAQLLIDRLLETMQARSRNLRWVAAENRHLTLAFLGDISPKELETVKQGFAHAYAGNRQFHYQFLALERFPNSRGQIIALTGESSESLLNLAMATRDLLGECGLGYERKKFRPHITLARIRNPKHPVGRFERKLGISVDINRVVLYRSTLTESGSLYTPLMETALS